MKNKIRTMFAAGAIAFLILPGCSKSSDENPVVPPNTTPSAPTITISDGYGALGAVRSVSYSTIAGVTIPLEVNTAVAVFTASLGSGSLLDGGTVSINGKNLTKSSNNAYMYQNLTDPLSFSAITWSVSGSGSVPAISYTDDRKVPDYSDFGSLPTTITKSVGLTIDLGSHITNADSVYVVLTDYNNHQHIKRLAGSATECAVTPGDLSDFANGQGMIQVCPWNYKSEDISGKRFYFIIESAYTKQGVTIR
jgi:hypothetical protein